MSTSWKVLVLDSGMEPVQVVSWTRAMSLLFSGKAEIVEEREDVEIRSTSRSFKLPSIIRQFNNIVRKRKAGIPFTRHNIFLRDQYICQYCGKAKTTKQLTWDHVVPRCQGGQTVWNNIVTACFTCNQTKAGRTPEQAGMALRTKPRKPNATVPVTIRLKGPPSKFPESWRAYLDPQSFAYWNVELVPG
jgi:5-methylcytosine-specific restriction endonuclease McrA